VRNIGKEATGLDEAVAGMLHRLDEAVAEYADPGEAAEKWAAASTVLRAMRREETAREAGITSRHLHQLISGEQNGSSKVRAILTALAVEYARRLGENDGLPAAETLRHVKVTISAE